MSWSVNVIGKPVAVKVAIEKECANYGAPSDTNFSRAEFEAAKPALLALVDLAVGNKAVKVNASGHGTYQNGVQIDGYVSVNIDTLYGFVE